MRFGAPLATTRGFAGRSFSRRPRPRPPSKGNRTVKDAPRPGPSLCAVTDPPCNDTRLLTMARPRPSPPRHGRAPAGPARTSRRSSAACRPRCRCRCRHAEHDLVALAAPGHGDPAARLGVLRGVRQQVRNHLGEPAEVGVHGQAALRDVDVERVPLLLEQRARHLDRLRDDVCELDRLALQLDLAACDPRDVEQIVDEADEVLDLALDDACAPARRHRCRAAGAAGARSGSARAGCAARGRASRGTRPSRGSPTSASSRARGQLADVVARRPRCHLPHQCC